jgi:hypothetical protein
MALNQSRETIRMTGRTSGLKQKKEILKLFLPKSDLNIITQLNKSVRTIK